MNILSVTVNKVRECCQMAGQEEGRAAEMPCSEAEEQKERLMSF